ncbi:HNH endonuclease, partial [Vibrio parahaemolyticus]
MDATQTDDESIVGEACHIVARSEDGPRGASSLTSEQRDKYNNLLLLCNVHHKVIDDQPEHYTVEHLRRIKSDHETWVTSQLASFDAHKQR